MRRLRILVVDDHEVVRKGIHLLLEARRDWEICGEAAGGREAVERFKKLKPDLVILDLSLPDKSGLEVALEMLRSDPHARLLVLTIHESGQMVSQALGMGARGVVLKSDAGQDLVRGVEAVSQDKPFLSPRMTEVVMRELAQQAPLSEVEGSLTNRERQVLRLVSEGKSDKEIAAALGISPKTVDAHRANIMHKLNLHSVKDLLFYAVRHHIVEV